MDWDKFAELLEQDVCYENFSNISADDMEIAAKRFIDFAHKRREQATLTLTAKTWEDFDRLSQYAVKIETAKNVNLQIKVRRARTNIEIAFETIEWKEL